MTINYVNMSRYALILYLIAIFSCKKTPPSPAKSCCEGGGVSILNPDGSGFWMPSAFTPNDDGINDLLAIYGNGVKQFTLKIYSGQKVVFTTSTLSFWGWDGKIDSKSAVATTYKVIVEGQFTNNGGFAKETHLCLIKDCWPSSMEGCINGDQYTNRGFIEGSISQDSSFPICP